MITLLQSNTGEVYYPFGMTIRDLSRNGTDVIHKNEYLYNGKMHQDEMGLNLLDYGARIYDPVLGRWHCIDNSAEKYKFVSPYIYVLNNPIKLLDPDGNDIKIYYAVTNKAGHTVGYKSWSFNGMNQKNAPNNAFVRDFLLSYEKNTRNGGGEKMKEAAKSIEYTISLIKENEKKNRAVIIWSKQGSREERQETAVFWNPNLALKTTDGYILSPSTLLEEEFDHAVDQETDSPGHYIRQHTEDEDYENKEEKRAKQGSVKRTAIANNEVPKNWQGEKNHNGTPLIINEWQIYRHLTD